MTSEWRDIHWTGLAQLKSTSRKSINMVYFYNILHASHFKFISHSMKEQSAEYSFHIPKNNIRYITHIKMCLIILKKVTSMYH